MKSVLSSNPQKFYAVNDLGSGTLFSPQGYDSVWLKTPYGAVKLI